MNKRKVRDIIRLAGALFFCWLYIPHFVIYYCKEGLRKTVNLDLDRRKEKIELRLRYEWMLLFNLHNNGITGAYAFALLIPLYLLNQQMNFVDSSLIITVILADLVFCLFNFRPKGKAKCFAGDVGSIGMAFILMFLVGGVILKTADITYLIFLLVYGIDGCFTIFHRIMLHENLGEAHRKHLYQIMAK